LYTDALVSHLQVWPRNAAIGGYPGTIEWRVWKICNSSAGELDDIITRCHDQMQQTLDAFHGTPEQQSQHQ
jgi:hypothetical protein